MAAGPGPVPVPLPGPGPLPGPVPGPVPVPVPVPGPLPVPLLVAAAREAQGPGRQRRRLPAARALQAAGEVLAVAAGLKPALLWECGPAGAAELRRYLQRLRAAGLLAARLHVLALGGSALVLRPGPALARLLRARPAPLLDVSTARGRPALLGPAEARALRRRLAALLGRLRHAEAAAAEPVTASEAAAGEWSPCAVAGALLGYPAVYSLAEGAENCLALTPLRVFTAQAACPRIKDGLRVRICSFSVPESLCAELRDLLDAWCQELREAFAAQRDFVDLCISSEVVSLPAVAL